MAIVNRWALRTSSDLVKLLDRNPETGILDLGKRAPGYFTNVKIIVPIGIEVYDIPNLNTKA